MRKQRTMCWYFRSYLFAYGFLLGTCIVGRWSSWVWEPCSRHLWLRSRSDRDSATPSADEEIRWTVALLCVSLHADDWGTGKLLCFVQIFVWFSEYGLLSNRSFIQSVKSCLFDTESVKVYFKCYKIEFTSSQYGACLIQFHVIKKSLD